MPSNPDLRTAEAVARSHVNAAVDALLLPFRGPDGNCRRPDPQSPAEMAAWDAYLALARVTADSQGDRGALSRLERATRQPQ